MVKVKGVVVQRSKPVDVFQEFQTKAVYGCWFCCDTTVFVHVLIAKGGAIALQGWQRSSGERPVKPRRIGAIGRIGCTISTIIRGRGWKKNDRGRNQRWNGNHAARLSAAGDNDRWGCSSWDDSCTTCLPKRGVEQSGTVHRRRRRERRAGKQPERTDPKRHRPTEHNQQQIARQEQRS